MNHVLRAFAGLALIVPTVASARAPETASSKTSAGTTAKKATAKKKSTTKASAKTADGGTAKAKAKASESAPPIIPSEGVARVAEWVSASQDNHALPYAIVDKTGGALFLFSAKGKPLAAVPVLVGIAPGDEATPGVGSKKLAEIGPAEKTTPAGRFLAKFGRPFRGERILWVDYATSVALHPIPTDVSAKEKRRERMLSPTAEDNRITFGCINVPKAFYGKALSPAFRRKGGYVYVLPDTKPIEDVFPRLRVQALATSASR